ncbi:ABC transporter permease [Robertmurraya massiliosenegalensis]|uniref:ABC transporter permease n=1 Tax=Robertmurraya TaxID=2837507 RepID=UPI0039A59DEC
MWSFLKKDLLVFWRDRIGLLMSLLLPIVLIIVLNFAFAGLFNGEENQVNISLGVVQDEETTSGLREFEDLVEQMALPSNEKEELRRQASLNEPKRMLENFLHNPELKEWIKVEELTEEEALRLVADGKLDAYLKIPKRFTEDVLSAVILGEDTDTSITIQAEEFSTEVQVLQNMVNQFVHNLNFQFALKSTGETSGNEPVLPVGGIEKMEETKTYTMVQYFTIAMSTLFTLFIAQTVAMKTVTEKRERVFNRIILSNSNPLAFLMGKTISTFCFCWVQIILTLVAIQLLFDVFPDHSIAFWNGLLLVLTFFVFTVSGLSALFTMITLRLQDLNAANGIFTVMIMMMAALGGNFFPLQGLPEVFQKIGDWTPNGLTQSVLIKWIQNGVYTDLWVPLSMLIVFFIGCMVVSVALFPRKESM